MELTVQVPVKHSGKWYQPGETIKDLSEQDYNRLKNVGADVKNEGPKVSGQGTFEVLDWSAPDGAKIRNRSEFVKGSVDKDGMVTETYK